jgi:pimeloyl-ACP methyl ester carboxylesterase
MSAYGPRERLVDGHIVYRKDLVVINRNQKKLEGFLFFCPQIPSQETVLYLHGNGGSKLEAMPLVELITKFGMNLAAFDLPGCGNSDP